MSLLAEKAGNTLDAERLFEQARAEIVEGLTADRKRIAPKYFYDEAGSQLFEQITELPEYYLTDAELDIMRTHVDEIAGLAGPQASLIEFGSGSSLKTRMLLEHFEDIAAYVPVDISAAQLERVAAEEEDEEENGASSPSAPSPHDHCRSTQCAWSQSV